jgi:hypothetical protein
MHVQHGQSSVSYGREFGSPEILPRRIGVLAQIPPSPRSESS